MHNSLQTRELFTGVVTRARHLKSSVPSKAASKKVIERNGYEAFGLNTFTVDTHSALWGEIVLQENLHFSDLPLFHHHQRYM